MKRHKVVTSEALAEVGWGQSAVYAKIKR